MYIYDILLNSFQNEKHFRQVLWRKSKHTMYVNVLKIRAVYEIMQKNMVEPLMMQMKDKRMQKRCIMRAR